MFPRSYLPYLIGVENILGSLSTGACSIPELCLGIFLPDIEMKYVVVPRAVIRDNCQCVWFVVSYSAPVSPT